MIFLLLSILLSSYLTLSFKVLAKLRISSFQAIVFNYFTCMATGSLLNGQSPLNFDLGRQPWLPWAVVMGLAFISMFNLIAFTAQRLGVSVASVANKLSLVIPFIFSVYLYDEQISLVQVSGICLALAAVVLTSWPHRDRPWHHEPRRKTWINIVPVILFAGSGLLDTLIKYVEQGYLGDTNADAYLTTAFGFAGLTGLLLLLAEIGLRKAKFDYRAILAGICIGVPNYFSIWCLVRVLQVYGDRSSAVIPVNNMAIVLVSTLAAWLIFREYLSQLNWWGIGLSVVAIAMIAYG